MFEKAKNVFFVGIGGIGISAVARMFLHEGRRVAGSDFALSEITEELRKAGAKIGLGQTVDLIPKDTDLIIYTVAIEKADPAFFELVKSLGIPLLSYPEALREISKGKYTIAVSGTHGKTTTTAMIARILVEAGLDPTVIVGSLLQGPTLGQEKGRTLGTNFISGKSKYFVVEACEYKRSFLQLLPTIAVITNIDDDHLDYYKDINDIAKAFGEFVHKVPKKGSVVSDMKSSIVKKAVAASPGKKTDYTKVSVKGLSLKVPGKHNVKNAKAALAVADILGIERAVALEALNNFTGTWRRFEYKGKMKNGAAVYDDYGHHPTEIEATIEGARDMFPNKKITVVFQPHLFSRTKQHFERFAEVLAEADRIILADIYPAREPFDSTISSKDIVERIKKTNKDVLYLPKFEDIVTELKKSASDKDVILTMGAGETNKIAETLVS